MRMIMMLDNTARTEEDYRQRKPSRPTFHGSQFSLMEMKVECGRPEVFPSSNRALNCDILRWVNKCEMGGPLVDESRWNHDSQINDDITIHADRSRFADM
jgi:hypothetical protein